MKKIIWIGVALLLAFFAFILIAGKTTFKINSAVNLSESNFYKEYYNSDDLLLINCWATWCRPCIEEFPVLDKMRSEFKPSELKMLSISLDKDTTRLKNFLRKRPEAGKRDITMQNLSFRDSIYRRIKLIDEYKNPLINFSSTEIPYVVLIKNKKILYSTHGDLDLGILRRIISENSSKNWNQ